MSDYWSRVNARLSRRRMLGGATGAIAGGFALAAVGCGDDDDDDTGDEVTATQTIVSGEAPVQSASATTTRTTKEGERVRVALGSEPTVADPHQSTGGVDNFYLFQLFNQLYEWDNKGASTPALAESYEVTPDGTQITFKIRSGVKFHNGDPLTSKDVAYSFTRLLSPDNKGTKTAFANVDKVETPDDNTFIYKMKKPDAGFILGGFGGLFIVPQAYTESTGADGFGKAPIGTGAYKLKDRTVGTGANFERNDEYFRGKGGFKTAEMKIVPDGTSRLQMVQVGDVDVMQAVAAEQLRVLRGVSGVKTIIQNSNIDTHYALAIKDYPDVTASEMTKLIRDKRVRQALNYAVDKKALAENVYTSEMAQPYAVTNPTQPWDIKKSYDFDLKKAKDLLAAAGASNLSLIQYNLGGGRLPGLASLSAAVASNLRDAGVQVDERTEEYNAWLARLRNDTPPFPDGGMIFSWASTAGYPDPFQGVDSKWTCAARYGQYCASEFDTLINQARTMFNPEERTTTLKKAFDLMYDEAPALWLVLLQEAYAIRTGVVANWTPRAGSNPVLRLEDLIPA
ncbi:MAG: ABC transporter substrate-binding protein [Dehalococcoidia bacterium]|nr:ABC transporter substrate-binding protein [Dehalococcoidia bacterium]